MPEDVHNGGDADESEGIGDPFEFAGNFVAQVLGKKLANQIDPDKLPPALKELLTEEELRADDPRLIKALASEEVQKLLALSAPVKPMKHEGVRIGRNDPCHCGSGIKFKKCCGRKH